MINIESNPIKKLSDGHYMVSSISPHTISLMWTKMSRQQKEEFEIVYGVDCAEDGFSGEIEHADHKEAFFCGADLTCLMWADWATIGNIGRIRVVGCVCSDFAYKHPINFCKHSKEVRDSFLEREPQMPDGNKEIYVMITDTFSSSRKWAVKFCGCEESFKAVLNDREFTIYRFVKKGGE